MVKRHCSLPGCNQPHKGLGFCKEHWYRFKAYGDPYAARRKAKNGEPLDWLLQNLGAETDLCVEWPFNTGRGGGYGTVWIEGRSVPAHRHVCELVHGAPPSLKHQAAHGCGNRRCVNPRHLRWATNAENQADRCLHGTSNAGERNPMHKLTEADVRSIKSRIGIARQSDLAREFGVSDALVSLIASGKKWSHVTV